MSLFCIYGGILNVLNFLKTNKTQLSFYKKLMLKNGIICYLLLWTFLITGCSVRDSVQPNDYYENTESTEYENCVVLQDIHVPEFGEIFFLLSCNNDNICISWGIGKNFLWYDSGFPGFGMPMIIELSEDIQISSNDTIILSTDYGNFEYIVYEDGTASAIDDKLVCRETLQDVIQFGINDEVLVVYCNGSKRYFKAHLAYGPQIVLGV